MKMIKVRNIIYNCFFLFKLNFLSWGLGYYEDIPISQEEVRKLVLKSLNANVLKIFTYS